MSTDHRMILVELNGEGVRRNRRHCKARSIWSIVAPKGVPTQEGDSHFSDLKKMVKKIMWKARVMEPWISEAACRLADQRTALRRGHT